MAESQLMVMEDGHIGAKVPENKPEFYYSEEQRCAIEELLKNGDGAFKTRLKEDKAKDFLSAREVKVLQSTFKQYDSDSSNSKTAASRSEQGASGGTDADSGVHSTYWPQMSDTEVPSLDIGWPSGGLFKGVTRVAVHTHPPKDNGPHIKEVVRRLIQEASKVIAIVMDMLTDIHILQDLMDAASRRSVPVYIVLDEQAVAHFLDVCSRLQIGAQQLRYIRVRMLQGVGFSLSFGKLPGSLCSKYMLVDGDKVAFGSFSFSWSASRMDRNMITVMTGQVVDFFDRDFRELYAISDKVDLYKEFHVSPPASKVAATIRSKSEPKRPPLPATTSRFQVSLGDSQNPEIQVPAHKYYNPKYSLLFGGPPRPARSLQDLLPKGDIADIPEEEGRPRLASSVKIDRMLSEAPTESAEEPAKVKKKWFSFKSKKKLSAKEIISPLLAENHPNDEIENSFEGAPVTPTKGSKKLSKLDQKASSQQTVNTAHDRESLKSGKSGKSVKSRRKGPSGCKTS
ncbi:PREDICTED: protein FAM83F [Cyprinodon variegatus]|uniref:Family with sequence similarity 83 member Fb n=1 Tax=Cyprinodon variegatus TaxID=28743 RepID=A0A3Q2E484_CYPVA|nr:PREDICTED: protein FAM83F [Cyprinodon variegatus]